MKQLPWPVSIGSSNGDNISYHDVVGHSFTLKDAAPRLFSDQIEIEACKIDRDGENISSNSSILKHLLTVFEVLKESSSTLSMA
jgi:hypothetical protein